MTCWAVSLISEELIFLCIWCLKGREKEERNVIRKEIFKYIEFWWLVVSHWFNGSTANQSVSSYIRLRRERERERVPDAACGGTTNHLFFLFHFLRLSSPFLSFSSCINKHVATAAIDNRLVKRFIFQSK